MVQIHSPRPTFRISDLLHTKIRRAPESNQHFCLTPVGRKHSLFFESIPWQRRVRFTDNPFFEKEGTGSGSWKKNQKARFKSCFCGDVILLCSWQAIIQGKIFHCHFVQAEGPFCA